MVTEGAIKGFTSMVMELLVAGLLITQFAFEVTTTLTWLPLASVDEEKEDPVAPETSVPFICH